MLINLSVWPFKIHVHENEYFPFFRAVNELQETEFRGQTLQARLTERRSPRRSGGGGLTGGSNNPRHVEFPLRILVQSDMVGAIIGRGGQTIRQITQQTR